MEELSRTIARIKPLADDVVERAAALNEAIRAAADAGLAVRLEVVEQGQDADGEAVPALRARISKRLA